MGPWARAARSQAEPGLVATPGPTGSSDMSSTAAAPLHTVDDTGPHGSGDRFERSARRRRRSSSIDRTGRRQAGSRSGMTATLSTTLLGTSRNARWRTHIGRLTRLPRRPRLVAARSSAFAVGLIGYAVRIVSRCLGG
jgi:hypothetical protein